MTSQSNPSVELYRHVASEESATLSTSSQALAASEESEATPRDIKKPRVRPSGARQLPGVLDPGAGLLATFNGPSVNRRVARRFAREFKNRWNHTAAHDGAFKLLQQCKKILALDEKVTSGSMVASRCTAFGAGGIDVVDKALANDLAAPHSNDAEDERIEDESGLFLWAVYWQELRCVPY